jgi:hypothetical protein
MRKPLPLSALALAVAALAIEPQVSSSEEPVTSPRAEVLVLGVYHMANPRRRRE